jgi:hypothetical protein
VVKQPGAASSPRSITPTDAPPFRGTLSLEEAWAMGRYLRTFVPGAEVLRPDLGTPDTKLPPQLELPKEKKGP